MSECKQQLVADALRLRPDKSEAFFNLLSVNTLKNIITIESNRINQQVSEEAFLAQL
jgi:hypothetical protein